MAEAGKCWVYWEMARLQVVSKGFPGTLSCGSTEHTDGLLRTRASEAARTCIRDDAAKLTAQCLDMEL